MSVPPFDAVVVHCTTYLGHLEAIFAMLPVQTVTIYSKCGVMPQLEVRAATRLRIVNASNIGIAFLSRGFLQLLATPLTHAEANFRP